MFEMFSMCKIIVFLIIWGSVLISLVILSLSCDENKIFKYLSKYCLIIKESFVLFSKKILMVVFGI